MSNFVNPDGSALVGALLPSSVGQALNLDANGNLKTTVGAGGGGGAITAADGALVTIGTSTDAANANTVIGQLKQIKTNQSGSNAVTAASGAFVDGAITTIGQEADAAATTDTGTFTLMAFVKRLLQKLPVIGPQLKAASMSVTLATDSPNIPVQGGFLEVIGQGPGVVNGVNTYPIPSTDVSAYNALSLQIGGAYVGSMVWEFSNDNVTWSGCNLSLIGSITPNNESAGSSNTNQIWVGSKLGRYFRIRMTAFTSNTSLATTLELYTVPPNHILFGTLAQQTGVWTVQPGNTPNTTAWLTQNTPATSGGTSDFHLVSAASTNSNNIKATAGQVYGWSLGNNSATTDCYVKLYNKATAPTVGTDTPFRTIYVPKGQSVSFHSSTGLALGTGIGVGITAVGTDADTTAVAANQVNVEIDYK